MVSRELVGVKASRRLVEQGQRLVWRRLALQQLGWQGADSLLRRVEPEETTPWLAWQPV